MAEATAIVGTVKEGIGAASDALDLYTKMVDMTIPWDTFTEAIDGMNKNIEQYSDDAASLIGKIQTLLLDSADQHSSSQEEVNRWCKVAVPLLGRYITLFEHVKEKKVAEAQKTLLLAVLNEGSAHLDHAVKKLEKSRESFNSAYGELTTLQTQLELDFDDGSAFYENSVSKLRKEAYTGAVSGLVFGPIGLAVSYAIAAGVVEGELIPKLKEAFEDTKEKFSELQEMVEQAQKSIDYAKVSITAEISVVNSISAKIDTTKTFADIWVLIPELVFDDLKKSTTELIVMCNQYIQAVEMRQI